MDSRKKNMYNEYEMLNLKMEPDGGNVQINGSHAQPVLKSEDNGLEEDEFWPLSGKPHFDVIITKSHTKSLAMPTKMLPFLPSAKVPVTLTNRGRSWEMLYRGDISIKRFDPRWKAFAIDNNLKIGDACVFELSDCSPTKLTFRVQILRGDFPEELLAKVDGAKADTPIVIE